MKAINFQYFVTSLSPFLFLKVSRELAKTPGLESEFFLHVLLPHRTDSGRKYERGAKGGVSEAVA